METKRMELEHLGNIKMAMLKEITELPLTERL